MTPLYFETGSLTALPQGHCSTNQRIETTGLSGTVTLLVGDEIKVQLFTNDGISISGMVIENETCRFYAWLSSCLLLVAI